MKRFVAAAAVALVMLTGCTVQTDAFVGKVKAVVTETSFEDTEQMASGCIGVYLLCTQPMYEPVFFASESVAVEEVCNDAIAVARKLGVVAYAVSGYDAYEFPKSGTDVLELCTAGLGSPLINTDGSAFYQGLVLFDDGKVDGFGKVYSLSRGPSEFGEGYLLIISFSKDSNRVGYISYGTEKPELMTQDRIDGN